MRQLSMTTQVEFLERRAMLTPLTLDNASPIFFGAQNQVFPYPSWSEPVGTVVTTISFTDTNFTGTAPNQVFAVKNPDITITGGNTNNAFFVDPATGVLTVNNAAALDTDISASFTLTITQTDNQNNAGTGTLTIILVDGHTRPIVPQFPYLNDTFDNNAPPHTGPMSLDGDIPNTGDSTSSDSNFPVNQLDFLATGVGANVLRVKENSPAGTIIGTVTATVPDNPGATSTLTYRLIGTIPGFNSSDPAIAIDPFTGKIRIIDPAFFNYEALRIANSSQGNLGESPLFPDGAGNTFLVPGDVLDVMVRATDTSGVFSQTWQASTGQVTDSHVYIRVLDVGEIPPNVSQATTSMSVNETVSTPVPGASVVGTSVGFFDMIDGVPNFFNGAPPFFNVPSGSGNSIRIAKPASAIGLSTNEGQERYSYFIVGGNTNSAFAINPDTGEVTVNANVIDYEALDAYTLQIKVVSDNPDADSFGTVQCVAPLSTIASLHISVNDVNEQTVVSTGQSFSIPEGSVNGIVIGSVISTDPDKNQPNGKASLRYSIVSGNNITINGVQFNGLFAIDPITGILSVKNTTGLPNATVLNFLQQRQFQLTVQVVDRSDLITSGNAAVTINLTAVDTTPPVIQTGNESLQENSANGTIVGQVVAAAGQSDFSIASYQIVAGNTNNAFAIDSNGQLTVNNQAAIDFETTPVFNLTIKVTDNGVPSALSSTAVFTINLLNINEQIAMLNQSFTANENTANGIIIGQIQTTDPDNEVSQIQGQFFTISGGNTGGAFSIDALGHIIVSNSSALNFETTPSFSLIVTATDTGVPPTATSATITVNLTNVNDAPVIGNQAYSINEHSLAGTIVNPLPQGATNALGATDEDLPAQTLTFAITGGNPTGAFSIDPATGVISVTDPGLIDFATTPKFNLIVSATDNGTPNLTSSATVTVNLLDVQEPRLSNQTVTLPENSANTTVVATVAATHGVAPYTYSIIGGNANPGNGQANAFSIVALPGGLSANIVVNNSAALDFETHPVFSLQVLVVDSQSTPLGDTATVTVNLTNINEAPKLSSIEGSALNYTENSVTAITATLIASDVDSANATGATVQITGGYLNGQDTLVFTNSGNITGSFNSANGKLTLSGTDTFAHYQAALRSVAYKNLSDNPSTVQRTVTFQITDSGALSSNTVARAININPVNDPPVLSAIESTPLNYIEKSTAAISATVTSTDPDSLNLQGAVIQISSGYINGQDTLVFINTAKITGAWNASTGTLTLTGVDTLANYNTAIRSVGYHNLSANPSLASRTVSFSVSDTGGLSSNSVSRQINIIAVDDAPTLTSIESSNVVYTENINSIVLAQITATLNASDPDSTNAQGATISITGNYANGQDKLVFTNTATITGSWNASTGTLTLSGVDTLVNYRTALRSVKYEDLSHNPSSATRTVSFTLTDDQGASSLPVTRDITVIPVNNPPVLNSAISNVSYTEGSGARSINGGMTVADPDNTTLSSAVVTITNFNSAEDVIEFVSNPATTGNISIASNLNGVLRLTSSGATATLAQWQAAFRAVTYTNTSGNLNPPPRTVTFVANDGGSANNVSNTFTSTINTIAIFPPVLAGSNNLDYTEKDPATAIDPVITVTDPGTPTLKTATITITNYVVGGQDVLSFVNDGSTMGNIAVQSNIGGVLQLFSAGRTATLAQWQSALRSVTYRNLSYNPSATTRNVTYQVSNGLNVNDQSNVLASTITITAVNDPPLLTNQDLSVLSYTQDSSPKAIVPNVLAADPDSNFLTGATIRISSNYNYQNSLDTLSFKNTSTITGNWNVATGTLTLTGTDSVSNYRTALRSITFTNQHDGLTAPPRIVSFTVKDDTNLTSNTISRTISITTVNEASILTGIETTEHIYKANDPFTPPSPITSSLVIFDNNSPTLLGATIQISSGYNMTQDRLGFSVSGTSITGSFDQVSGTLTLSGADTLAHYQAALRSVIYFNTAAAPTTGQRTVRFQVTDNTNLQSNFVSRNVSILTTNTSPTLTLNASGALQYTENDPATPVVPGLVITDPDSPNMQSAIVKITGNYQQGQDKLSFKSSGNLITGVFDAATGTLTLTGSDTQAHYQDALRSVSYVNTNDNPSALTRTINFIVNDGLAPSGAINARQVVVIPVNDAPVVAINAGALAYTPSQGKVALAPALTVGDADSANLTSATIQITFNYQRGADVLSFVNTTKITGVFDVATGTLKLTGTDTVSNYRAALRTIMYQFNGTPITATKIATITASDGISLSSAVTRNINIS